MNNDRKDEIQELYDKTNKISNLENIIFLLNIIISLSKIFFKNNEQWSKEWQILLKKIKR